MQWLVSVFFSPFKCWNENQVSIGTLKKLYWNSKKKSCNLQINDSSSINYACTINFLSGRVHGLNALHPFPINLLQSQIKRKRYLLIHFIKY